MPVIILLEPFPRLRPLLSASLPPALGTLAPPGWTGETDLLVLAPARGKAPPSCPPCRVVLAPEYPGALSAPAAVSYGPSPRDTLTFSSLNSRGMVLSLQREVVTLTGSRLDRQELPLPCRGDPLTALAWAGTLLLAGVAPGDLAPLAARVFFPKPPR